MKAEGGRMKELRRDGAVFFHLSSFILHP